MFGPWQRTEYFLNLGEGFHGNDARGVVATIDPKTGAPIDRATPLVRAKGTDVDVQRVAAMTGIRELRVLPEGSRASFDIDVNATASTRAMLAPYILLKPGLRRRNAPADSLSLSRKGNRSSC